MKKILMRPEKRSRETEDPAELTGRRYENAIVKALEYMNDGYDWIVDMDLSKFFDNINQDILMILVHQLSFEPPYAERHVRWCERSESSSSEWNSSYSIFGSQY